MTDTIAKKRRTGYTKTVSSTKMSEYEKIANKVDSFIADGLNISAACDKAKVTRPRYYNAVKNLQNEKKEDRLKRKKFANSRIIDNKEKSIGEPKHKTKVVISTHTKKSTKKKEESSESSSSSDNNTMVNTKKKVLTKSIKGGNKTEHKSETSESSSSSDNNTKVNDKKKVLLNPIKGVNKTKTSDLSRDAEKKKSSNNIVNDDDNDRAEERRQKTKDIIALVEREKEGATAIKQKRK